MSLSRNATGRVPERRSSVFSFVAHVKTSADRSDRLGSNSTWSICCRYIVQISLQQTSNKSNRRSLSLMHTSLACTVVGVRNISPPSTVLLTSLNGVPWRNFYKSTVAHTQNGLREPNHVSFEVTSLPVRELLLQCFYLAKFRHNTTLEVYVTACDLENSSLLTITRFKSQTLWAIVFMCKCTS